MKVSYVSYKALSFFEVSNQKRNYVRQLPGVLKSHSHYARPTIYLGKQRSKFGHSLEEVSDILELGITPEILHHWYFGVTNHNFQ